MHYQLSNCGKYETTIGVQSFESRVIKTTHRQPSKWVATIKSSASQGIKSERNGVEIVILILKKICKLVKHQAMERFFREINHHIMWVLKPLYSTIIRLM